MNPEPSRFSVRNTLIAVVLLAIGFVGGQLAPTVVTFGGPAANERPDFNELSSIYDTLVKKFDGEVKPNDTLEGAKAGLVAGLGDPYTVYLKPKEAKDLEDQLNGTLSGVGAEVAIRNNKLTVVSPIVDSPAAKAGVRAGDVIISINGQDSSTMTLDEAVSKIRGPKGSEVTLKIIRGSSEPIEIKIVRDVITVPSVKSSMKENGIGYIQLTQFGSDTVAKLQQAAADLKAQGATKVILDLRNNPGGYLDGAVDVSSQFLPDGKTVVEERRQGRTVERLQTTGGGQLVGLPLVVLINEGSASASEIVAGALRDNKAGQLLGEKSFGKGSVQEVIKLGDGAELKVTVAHWFTPSGQGIDKVGIKPDIEVKLEQADLNAGRDPQLERAIQELSK